MNKLRLPFFLLTLVWIAIGCGEDEPKPTVQELTLPKLVKTWTLTAITLDNVNKKTANEYNNFKLNLSGVYAKATPDAEYNYSVSGRTQLSPWPASGKWKFDTTSPETTIVRDKGTDNELQMTYKVTDISLEITFNYQGTGIAGRSTVVKGQWVMTFN